jgi:hypothetical protein
VAVESDGRVTAVWFRAFAPGQYGLQSSTRSATGSWTAPVDLPGATTADAEAALALRPGGTAVVAWPRTVAGLWTMSSATGTTTGAWGAPTDLMPGSPVMPGRPRVDVDGAGATTAVWSASDGAHWTVRAATATLSGAWGAPVAVSPAGQDAVDPDVTVTGNGYAVAVWSRWNGLDRWVAQTSARDSLAGPWAGPVDLSGSGLSAFDVEVATNDAGSRFVAAWTATPDSGTPVVQAAVREVGPWRPSVTLSDGASASTEPSVVVSDRAPATVTWRQVAGSAHVVRSAVLPWAAPGFGVATDLSSPDQDAGPPYTAADRSGDVVVVWGATAPSTFQPRFAAYDVAGPSLRTVRSPGHVVAGASASYQASAVDAWSAVSSYSWSFGDGTTATGPTATHTYAETGRYTLRLRVTDAAGNTTVKISRTKVVTGPAITDFRLVERRIARSDKLRMRLQLNVAAKVKLVLRSKNRHRVHGVLHRQKLVLRRDLDSGRSTVVIKGSRLLADTWVVTATARYLGVESAAVKKRLVVTGP